MKRISLLFVIAFTLISACSSGTDSKELMSNARDLEEGKKPAEALLLYEQLVQDYPEAPEAAEALFRSAVLYYNEQKDVLKAATTYELVCEKYPETEYAHKGLFIAAFTYENEIGNLDRARVAYNKYLANYPDSSWASEAQFALENLGKTPEELLESLQESAPAPAIVEEN